MKYILSLLTGIVIGFGLVYLFIIKASEVPCPPPSRPLEIPADAFWVGGCDGGYFFSYEKGDNGLIRTKIFDEGPGNLVLDANYSLDDCLSDSQIDSNFDFSEMIFGFDGRGIIIELNHSKDQCLLKPMLPAFGGYQWEIIKNK